MPSRIPVHIDGQDFPSINKASLFYREILHRHQPGQSVSDPDQYEIKRLIHSAQRTPEVPASDTQIRVIQGKYGRHCFALHEKGRPAQAISIMRSVRQCILSIEGPSSSIQPQPTAA
ncbi:hypothetical protein QF021_002240 [Acidovorax delafieldii]|uniref:hypothetical protein n=1 Tax=Acidovorax delafieldii TaxID=47920 RepID=UPI0028618046|nr:hypothetical protein [Acidovorax delafieldii]MDR6154151.1 hypothetical protein [Acidovorax delafieldii]